MFEPGTDATMTLPDGTIKPLGDLDVRATEYTVGANGDEAMPGELPATQRLHLRGRVQRRRGRRGGRHRRHASPSRSRPTSTTSSASRPARSSPPPTTTRRKGAWVPSDERRRDQDRGRGRRPATSTSTATTADGAGSPTLGIDDAELAEARAAVRRRQEPLARRGPALHAVGLQLAVRLPAPSCDAAERGPAARRRTAPSARPPARSSASSTRRSASSSPVPGTPFDAATTSSARVPGYKEAYRLDDPAHRAHRPAAACSASSSRSRSRAASSRRAFAPGARTCSTRSTGTARTRTADASRARRPRRSASATSTPAIYLEPAEFEAALRPVRRRPLTRNETGADESRREITAWQEWERPVGALGAGSRRARRLDARRPPRLRPAGPHALPRRRHRVTTEAIRSEIDTRRRRLRRQRSTDQAAATCPLGDRARHRRRRRRQLLHRRPRPTRPGQPAALKVDGGGKARRRLGDGGPPAGRARAATSRSPTTARSTSPTPATRRIRRVDPPATITTFAGGGDPDALGDGGAATAATLKQPRGLALAADGTLYVAETGRDRVRRVTPDGRITTVTTDLDLPTDVAVDAEGTLYIADAQPPTASLKITAAGREPTTLGARSTSRYGLDVADDGTVFVADRIHHVVRRIAKDGTIAAYAGTGRSGDEGDGSAPQQAQLSFPEDVTVAPDSRVQIADTGNAPHPPRRRRACRASSTPTSRSRAEDGTERLPVRPHRPPPAHGRRAHRPHARCSSATTRAGRLTTVTDGDGNVIDDRARRAPARRPRSSRPATCARASRSAPTACSARSRTRPERGASRSTTRRAACSRRSRTRSARTRTSPTTPRPAGCKTDEDKNGTVVTLTRERTATRLPRHAHLGHGQGRRCFEAEQLPGGGDAHRDDRPVRRRRP